MKMMKTAALTFLCALMLLSNVSEGRRLKRFCPRGWAPIVGRCLRYVPRRLTWARAERNCLSMGGNLASVRRSWDHRTIQRFIFRVTHKSERTWIGGSNRAEKSVWLWSDGTRMKYTNWCPRQPDNARGKERCLEMNFSGRKCWNDLNCAVRRPSVCVWKRTRVWFRG